MDYSVCIHCITYNHSAFIKDAMDGFCIQKTTFPYICVIIDDASTDGEEDIIRLYLRDCFDIIESSDNKSNFSNDYIFFYAQHKTNKNCFFAVYLLKYNHFIKHKTKRIYLEEWNNKSRYIAICEGDDYWISPDKLQRQVSFLDKNSNYYMACNRALLYSVKKHQFVGENYCYSLSRTISVKDVIYRTGLFISTCSLLFRKELLEHRPDYWISCPVGDYPLQIASVLKGKAWYFNETMSVYRVDNAASWMGTQDWGNLGADPERFKVILSQVKMFKGFGKDYPQYSQLFTNKVADHINRNIPLRRVSIDKVNAYLANFQEDISRYNLRWKIDLFFRKSRLPFVRAIYQAVFTRGYLVRNKWYK